MFFEKKYLSQLPDNITSKNLFSYISYLGTVKELFKADEHANLFKVKIFYI